MSAKYIGLPKKNFEITEVTLGNQLVFVAPIDVQTLIMYGGAKYAKVPSAMLTKTVNTFPCAYQDWVQAQKVVSRHFNSLIKTNWATSVAKEVWVAIREDFLFDPQKQFTEEEIEPFLKKLFF